MHHAFDSCLSVTQRCARFAICSHMARSIKADSASGSSVGELGSHDRQLSQRRTSFVSWPNVPTVYERCASPRAAGPRSPSPREARRSTVCDIRLPKSTDATAAASCQAASTISVVTWNRARIAAVSSSSALCRGPFTRANFELESRCSGRQACCATSLSQGNATDSGATRQRY